MTKARANEIVASMSPAEKAEAISRVEKALGRPIKTAQDRREGAALCAKKIRSLKGKKVRLESKLYRLGATRAA